jgi:hypothetical protein
MHPTGPRAEAAAAGVAAAEAVAAVAEVAAGAVAAVAAEEGDARANVAKIKCKIVTTYLNYKRARERHAIKGTIQREDDNAGIWTEKRRDERERVVGAGVRRYRGRNRLSSLSPHTHTHTHSLSLCAPMATVVLSAAAALGPGTPYDCLAVQGNVAVLAAYEEQEEKRFRDSFEYLRLN